MASAKKKVKVVSNTEDMQPIDLNMNLSGIRPIEFKVLVKQETVDETIKEITRNDGSKVSILRPQQNQEMEQAAATKGVIVAVSPLAFGYEIWPEDEHKPETGDKVIFAKYAGMKVKGNDGEDYLLINDKDIAGTVT